VAAKALIVKKEITHADAIVVLSGSATYNERVRLAARLLEEGRGSAIVLTNDGLLSGWSAADERNLFFFERSIEELRRLGVPTRQITTIPGRVNNTHEEAVAVREYAKANGLRSILVVTAPYQARRALWVFQRTFDGSGITIGLDSPAPGEQSPHPTTWWTRTLGWKLVPGEYIKIIYYRWNYSDTSYAAVLL
jgi:uncharacterized SAM-binding protein YcdF (DUF218 family)